MDNYKTDVLIIGGGLAGIVAALELVEKKISVLLLDRDTEENFGGLAPWAFGGMALVGTPLQKRSGVRDTPEIALSDWHSFAEFSDNDVWPRNMNTTSRHCGNLQTKLAAVKAFWKAVVKHLPLNQTKPLWPQVG